MTIRSSTRQTWRKRCPNSLCLAKTLHSLCSKKMLCVIPPVLLPKAPPPEEPPNRPPPVELAAPNAGAGDDPKAGCGGHHVSQGCLLWIDEGLARSKKRAEQCTNPITQRERSDQERGQEPTKRALKHTRSTVCIVGTEATKGAARSVVGLAKATTTKTAASKGHFEGRRSRDVKL